MFVTLRKARFGQIALMLAGFLAISGSFGLHPEPEPGLAAVSGSVAPSFRAERAANEATHECLACLAHRSISLPRLAAVVLQPGFTVCPGLSRAPSLLARLEAHPREGRAPPSLG